MALTRKFLKAMGLTDEQVDSVIEAHTETVDGLKKYKADAEKLPDVQKKLDDLKAAGDDGYKKKYEDLLAENTAKEKRRTKETALRALLKTLNMSDKHIDKVVKYTDLDALEMDGEKLKDESSRMDAIKKEWEDFIPNTKTDGAKTETPPGNKTDGDDKDLGSLSMEEYIAARKKKCFFERRQ